MWTGGRSRKHKKGAQSRRYSSEEVGKKYVSVAPLQRLASSLTCTVMVILRVDSFTKQLSINRQPFQGSLFETPQSLLSSPHYDMFSSPFRSQHRCSLCQKDIQGQHRQFPCSHKLVLFPVQQCSCMLRSWLFHFVHYTHKFLEICSVLLWLMIVSVTVAEFVATAVPWPTVANVWFATQVRGRVHFLRTCSFLLPITTTQMVSSPFFSLVPNWPRPFRAPWLLSFIT